jgi:type IV secretion system protein VirB11
VKAEPSYAAMLLDEILAPIADAMADPTVEDVAIQRQGEAWVRRAAWERVDVPSFDFETLAATAVLCCALRQHDIGRSAPMGGGDLHTGHRFQAVLPPAVPGGTVSLTFRKPSAEVSPLSAIPQRYGTAEWNAWEARRTERRRDSADLLALYDSGDVVAFMRAVVRSRRTPVICGATGSGKSYLGKSLLSEVSDAERIVTIEDALEFVVRQRNNVRLLFGAGGEGAVKPADCLHAALRMRPDRIPVQELREPHSAWVYLNEVSAGHPGSPTTIHGETAADAARRLFTLLKGGAGAGISDEVLIGMMGAAVDVIVPIGTDGSARHLGAVWFAEDAARRGETIADLLRAA